MTGKAPTEDGAVSDAGACHAPAQVGHKRARHSACDTAMPATDLTHDADKTSLATVRHELVVTGATATAAQPHANDAATHPATEQQNSPRRPVHERLFTSVRHYYANKPNPDRSVQEATHMARRVAREWPPCSQCAQLYSEDTGQTQGSPDQPAAPVETTTIANPAHGAEPHDVAAADATGEAASAEGTTAHSEPGPTDPDALLEFESRDCRIVHVFQRRGTVGAIDYLEVASCDAPAAAAMTAAATPGVIVVVLGPDDPHGLVALIASDTLPDQGLGGSGAGEAPALSTIVMAGQTLTYQAPTSPDNETPPPQPPPPPTTPTPVPTPIPTHLLPTAPPRQPQPPATPPHPGHPTPALRSGTSINCRHHRARPTRHRHRSQTQDARTTALTVRAH